MTRAGRCAAALLLLALPAGCGGGGKVDGAARESEKVVTVEVEKAKTLRLEDWLDLPGRIEAWREVTVSPEVGGLLEWRGVEEGDPVSKGQKMAVIDRENLELKVRQAELNLEQARLGASQAEIAVRRAEAALESAGAGETQAEAAHAQAREQERKARAVKEEREKELERRSALYREQLAPRSVVDELETALESSSADLVSAQEGVKAAEAGLLLAASGRKVAEAGVDAARESLTTARSLIMSAESFLEEARLHLRKSTILSPIDGFVDHVFNEQGEFVKSQDPLVRIVQTRPVKGVFHLAEKDVPFLRAGMEAVVVAEALAGREFTGKVHLIGVSSDSAMSTFPLEVRLENDDGDLRPGMLARLRVLRQGIDGAMSVPAFAVVRGKGGSSVFVFEEGVARIRAVETGIVEGERVQVVAGLAVGDDVIVKGQRDLEDGQKVALP